MLVLLQPSKRRLQETNNLFLKSKQILSVRVVRRFSHCIKGQADANGVNVS
jgi:hypothetical protein